jgi:hypothetical protein
MKQPAHRSYNVYCSSAEAAGRRPRRLRRGRREAAARAPRRVSLPEKNALRSQPQPILPPPFPLPPFPHQVGLAQMLKGGVIMDVTTAEEARIAEEAGAVAVMALERVPADIRKDGGVARMSDASMINAIKAAVTIPVMAKARIGHFVEAQILEALDVDYVDESEVRGGRMVGGGLTVGGLGALTGPAHILVGRSRWSWGYMMLDWRA